MNIPVFVLFIMGRGLSGFIDQSVKKDKKKLEKGYHFSSFIQNSDDIPSGDPIVLPSGVIDRFKQMDPKAVADLLLK